MQISREDLEAVRRVLEGKVSLRMVAISYSPHQMTLVGVTIIHAGDDPAALKKKGTYGSLLEDLVCNDHESYHHAGSIYDLMRRSHQLGLHRTADRAGNNLSLVSNSPLRELLEENTDYRRRAKEWYRTALRRVRANQAARAEMKRAEHEHYRTLRDELKNMPHSYLLDRYALQCSTYTLRALAEELLEIVDRYPE